MTIIHHVQNILKKHNPYSPISLFPYALILLSLSILFLLASCNPQSNTTLVTLWGEAQGTTYTIKYLDESSTDYQTEIDSILKDIDNSLSVYVPASIISRVNRGDSTVIIDKYFTDVFQKAMEVAERTDAAFDPTVAPLVNVWGFGFTEGTSDIDSAMIDSILYYVNYKLVRLENHKTAKDKPRVMLDFNAIAQGYTVDVLGEFFENKGIDNYLIELGGEIKARGKSIPPLGGRKGGWWKIGIDKPVENINEREIEAVIELIDKALATSGSYRKFYEKDGIKYSHTIDPKTGYPVRHSLLSATVIAGDCMTADAYATAFMVMGIEKSKEFLKENKDLNLDVYFIYSNRVGEWETYYSSGLKDILNERE